VIVVRIAGLWYTTVESYSVRSVLGRMGVSEADDEASRCGKNRVRIVRTAKNLKMLRVKRSRMLSLVSSNDELGQELVR
jgi:putative heme degradation protein